MAPGEVFAPEWTRVISVPHRHVHGSHLVYLPKPGVTISSQGEKVVEVVSYDFYLTKEIRKNRQKEEALAPSLPLGPSPQGHPPSFPPGRPSKPWLL